MSIRNPRKNQQIKQMPRTKSNPKICQEKNVNMTHLSLFSLGKFTTIFFTIHEGIDTLAQFSSNESYSAFLALVTNDDNIIIVDTQDAMCKKIIIRKRIKTLPLLSYKNDEMLNMKTLNKMLEIHIESFVNFFRLQGLDSEDLENHNTTIWIVSDDPQINY